MKQMRKRGMAFLLSLVMAVLLSLVMVVGLFAGVPMKAEAAEAYDANKAVNYAVNHWNANPYLACGYFVSDCLQAGGLSSFPDDGYAKLAVNNNLEGYGFQRNVLSYTGTGSIKSNGSNAGKVSVGDVIVYECYNGCLTYQHVALVTKISNDVVYTTDTNGQSKCLNTCYVNAGWYIDVGGHGYGGGNLTIACYHYVGVRITFWGVEDNHTFSGVAAIWAKRFDSDSNHYADLYLNGTRIVGHNYADSNGYFKFEFDTRKYTNGYYTIKVVYANTSGGGEDTKTIHIENTNQNPVGHVDSISCDWDEIRVQGWAYDPDAGNVPLEIHIYVGGNADGTTRWYAGKGNSTFIRENGYWGFDIRIKTSLTGTQNVYVWAINNEGETNGGSNVQIGQGTVNVVHKDTTKPTVSNMRIYDVTNKGYWVSCTVSDNVGVTSVKFPTWISGWSESQIKWLNGTLNGNTATCYVKASDFTTSSTTFATDAYAYDAAGNVSNYQRKEVYIDQDKPTVSNMKIYNVTNKGYWVSCTVSDNVGVTRVKFPTWLNDYSEEQIHWLDGTLNGNTATCYVNISEFTDKTYRIVTDIRAYDAAGNMSDVVRQGVTIDQEAPAVSDLHVEEEDEEGYTISCKVTDDHAGVSEVRFLTQTEDAEGVDASAGEIGTQNGDTYTFRVSYEEHDYAIGTYTTHIYVCDAWGNSRVEKVKREVLGDVAEGDLAQGEEVPNGLWIVGTSKQSYTYTGKAVKPEVRVYDSSRLLTAGRDYSISYKNNINANDGLSEKTAPTVTVKGKGNYTGKDSVTFVIAKKDISDADVTAENIVRKTNGKEQKIVPVLSYNGKKLKNKKDFTVSYPNAEEGAYKEAGEYTILVTGIGNYTGSREIHLSLTGAKLVSKLSVGKIAVQTYTGEALKPQVTVKDGKKELTEGTDYTVSYAKNREVGTAEAVITGIGQYAGTKKVTFKIAANASIGSAQIVMTTADGWNYKEDVYSGKEKKPAAYEVTVVVRGEKNQTKTVTLQEGRDYTVSYQNNIGAGTASVIFTGINGCSGSQKKTYKITAYDLGEGENAAERVGVRLENAYTYAKGGCCPKPVVTFDGTVLKEGRDYTLSYRNNNGVNDGSTEDRQPTVTVKGKGNFKGSTSRSYQITQEDLGDTTLTAKDLVWKNKAGIYAVKPVIKDRRGKKLSAGKDYDKKLVYTYDRDTRLNEEVTRKAGEEIQKQDILPAGTVIRVTAQAKEGGTYTGTVSGTYRVTKADIAKASVKIPAQIYTGRAVKVDQVMEVKLNRQPLSLDNYEIVGYSNNRNKGTASVTIRGINDCGGTKTIKFKIKSKGFLWWWR